MKMPNTPTDSSVNFPEEVREEALKVLSLRKVLRTGRTEEGERVIVNGFIAVEVLKDAERALGRAFANHLEQSSGATKNEE